MQEMTKDEQIAVMQAKIDEMTSAIFAKDRKIEELRKATADRNALEQECIQLRADKKRLRETKREACEALRAKEKELSKLSTLYGVDILPTAKAGGFLHQPPLRSNQGCCVLHDVRQALLPVCPTVRYVFHSCIISLLAI